jgi:GT2 family glycosyltransferase
MKISIITATYNSAAHTAGCLASVNNQSHHGHTMTQSHGMTNPE